MLQRNGFSLIDLVVSLGLVGVLAGLATPVLTQGRRVAMARSAADYLAGRFQLARTDAIKRHTHVAFRWEEGEHGYQMAAYRDGNGNGVRAADIAVGIDPVWLAPERLPDRFAAIDFTLQAGTPPLDETDGEDSTEPIRLGRSRILSFSPLGSASSGTIYVAGPNGPQLALRVLGATGRVRIFEFSQGGRTWRPR